MKVVFNKGAQKDFARLDKTAQKLVLRKALEVENLPDPRSVGRALVGVLGRFWRYRAGDYRLICDICDEKCIVLCVKIAHRKEAYR